LGAREKAGRSRVKRECYSLSRWKGQTEEALSVGSSRPAKLLRIITPNCGDLSERVRDPCGLVSLPAIRRRREVWRIGLDQKSIARHHPNQIVVRPFLERYDPAERDVPAGGDGEFGQRLRPGITVKDSDDSSAACLRDYGSRIVFRVPSMDNYRALCLLGQRDLGRESRTLRSAGRVVVVVIEAALADRDSAVLHKAAELGDVALGLKRRGVVGMNASSREDEARILRGVLSRHRGCIDGLADADNSCRARIAGAGDYRVAVAGERCVREVGVAVDEACRAPVLRGHLRSIQRRTGAAT
jgi:hypothetical protein